MTPVKDKVSDQACIQVWAQSRDQVWIEARTQVQNQVQYQVQDQITHIRDQIKSKMQ